MSTLEGPVTDLLATPVGASGEEDPYPLTPTQQGILFQSRHDGGSGLYHVQIVLDTACDIDIDIFRLSWAHVARRHPALRTVLGERPGGEPDQRVVPMGDIPLSQEDCSGLDAPLRTERLRELLAADRELRFATADEPLWRVAVLRWGSGCSVVWSLHYLMLDATSQDTVLREVEEVYDALRAGKPVPDRPALPYRKYVEWLDGREHSSAEQFWREELHGVAAARPLPVESRPPAADDARPAPPDVTQEQVPLLLDEEESAALRAAGERHGVGLGTLLRGCWAFLLSRYLGTEEAVIGITTSGRSVELPGIDRAVGQFVHTLPLRTAVPAAMGWGEWMRGLEERYERLREHEHSPLTLVRRWSGIPAGESLFAHVLTVEEPGTREPAGAGELRLTRVAEESNTGYPLSLVVTLGERIAVTFHYDPRRFAVPAIARMAGHLRRIAAGLVEAPDATLGQLTMLTDAEYGQLVHEWNDSRSPYSHDLCIHQLFERRAAEAPDATALLFGDRRLTYREVNERANQVAHHLRGLGVRRGEHIAVLMERSPEMVPALLGVLKAGAVYVPLEPTAPVRRWQYVIDVLGVTCVLTQRALTPRLLDAGTMPSLAHLVCLDDASGDAPDEASGEAPDAAEAADEGGAGHPYTLHQPSDTARMPRENPPPRSGPQDNAYVIFTSGSTGTPKGVTVQHAPAVNLIEWVNTTFQVGPEDRVLFVTSLSFDLSVYDIFGILAAGGQIRIATGEDVREPANLLRYLTEEPITFWDSAPAALMQLAPLLPTDAEGRPDALSGTLRLIFLSGDWIPVHCPDLMTSAFPNVRVVGLGGATEATVWSNWFPIDEVDPDWSSIPYGKPIQNARYYVLDESLRPCPLDVPGDLYIAGPCLSSCYAGEPELTAGKYIASPFGPAGERLYATGDSARWRPDGNLEFLGRTDSQVKIRGYRIELGEIDSVLSAHPAVRDAVTVVRDSGDGERSLATFFVPDPRQAHLAVTTGEGHGDGDHLLAQGRVEHWREVYDAFDPQADKDREPGSDFSGWNDSYTGRPLPTEEMRAWQDDTVALVAAYEPHAVLEIGCGTGLLLFQLAARCARYHGTDFSSSALTSVGGHLASRPALRERVTLHEGEAAEIAGLVVEPVDTVVVNSVIQYFPDADYLVRVLDGALGHVADGGRIVVGDVRSLPLLETFHADVETSRAPGATTRQQVLSRVRERGRREEELALAPEFFRRWAAANGRVHRVEVRLKRGGRNELTAFRYQVVLHVGPPPAEDKAPAPDAEATHLDWEAQQLTLDGLRALLGGAAPRRLRLTGIPNARTAAAARTLRWLMAGPQDEAGVPDTVQEWRALPAPTHGVDPEDVVELAERAGYRVRLDFTRHGADGAFTALATRDTDDAFFDRMERVTPAAADERDRDDEALANQPLKDEIRRLLLPLLSAHLGERLPGYMMPSDLVALDGMPITPSGKLDRRALLLPTATTTTGSGAPARTTTEGLLVAMWEQVLSRSPVGVFDDFFDLGGHSLLAVQLVARVRQVFGLDVPVRLFFELPTIAEVARELQRRQEEAQPERMPPLTPAPRGGKLPATFDQQRLFFLDRLAPGTTSYTVNWLIPLPATLDTAVISEALHAMVRRHEPLRTTLREEDGRVWQVVADELRLDLPLEDLSGLRAHDAEERARDEIRQWWSQPFDVSVGPLLRARLLKVSDTEQVLALAAHHTVFDGYSIGVFGREFLAACRALDDDSPWTPPELPLQYADYAVWQQSWLEKSRLAFHLDHWKGQLAEAPELLSLPTDFPRPSQQSFAGGFVKRLLPDATARQIAETSREHQVTRYITLLSAYAVFLSRYSGQDVVVIGVPIADRDRAELESVIGFLVNTVAVRVDLRGDPGFSDVLKQVRGQLFDAQAHREIPFEQVVEALRPARGLAHNPVFQAMFADESLPYLEHAAQLAPASPWMHELSEDGMSVGVARFDLTLMVRSAPDGTRFGFEYRTDLFSPRTVERMADHFEGLLVAALADGTRPVRRLALAEEGERERLATRGRGPDGGSPGYLPDLVTAQAQRQGADMALVSSEQRLTYSELERSSNRLAHLLRDQGVRRGTTVGLCVPRSVEAVVGQLAILKAGGVHVPLDPEYPRERLAYMAQDAGLSLVLAQRSAIDRLPQTDGTRVLAVEELWPQLDDWPQTPVRTDGSPDDLAYVMYTSGSTGRPKGVAVTHADVAALGCDHRFAAGHEVVLLHSAQAFDAVTYEVWAPLLTGGRVVVAQPGALTPSRLREYVAEHQVTAVWLTAALFHLFAQEDPGCMAGLAEVWTGGDAVRPGAVRRVREACHGLAVVDGYGPTETTVFATTYRVGPRDEVPAALPIGRPLDGMRAQVLDEAMQPAPTGVVGELYLGGAGLARGYLGRPDLTAEAFVADPFDGSGARLYRTGDLARFLDDGNIEFLGRVDEQVKIRGFRVEPGEIEAAVEQYPQVRAAAVMAHEDDGRKRLVAYVVGLGDQPGETLRAFLAERLPAHMVPAVYVPLESMPLNSSDKVDRRALAALPWREWSSGDGLAGGAPGTVVEERLAGIWQAVLGLDRPVGVHDNFFALGGDSILSLQVVFRARQQGLHVSVKQLFEFQSVGELAGVVGLAEAPVVVAEQGVVTGRVELTPIQRWFFAQDFVRPEHVNQSLLLEVAGGLDEGQWRGVVRRLLVRHDGLRAGFRRGERGWRAELAGVPDEVPWQVHDLAGVPSGERWARLLEIAGQVQGDFDLGRPPLLRAVLFTGLDATGPRLLLVAHHLVIDVVSWRILVEDLHTLIDQARQGRDPELPEKSSSWAAWAGRLRREASSETTAAEAAYWCEQAAAEAAVLPQDGPAEGNTVGRSREHRVVLDAEATRALLQDVPAVFDSRVNDALLTGVAAALGSWAGREQVRVDLEGHGREELFDDLDISRTTGWFTAISPVLLPVPSMARLGEGLKQIKELLRARPRQGIGYGLLAHGPGSAGLPGTAPAGISFNYLGQFDASFTGGFAASSGLAGPDWHPDNRRPYLIDVVCHVRDGQLHMAWTYGETAHREETIRRIAEDTLDALRELAAQARRPDTLGYTPSDLSLTGLTQERLDGFVEEWRRLPAWRSGGQRRPLADCYPQTAIQRGLWFQSHLADDEGVYHVQMVHRIELGLDVDAFRASWAATMRRHPILRTGFWETETEALQLVWHDLPVPLVTEDWRGRAPEERRASLEAYLDRDRAAAFTQTDAPQWRLFLARTHDERYELVWSAHHAVLDGWSLSLILNDVVRSYEELIAGRPAPRTASRPYRDYVTWLGRQDSARAEVYWRGALHGMERPAPLSVGRPAPAGGSPADQQADVGVQLGEGDTQALLDLCREHHLTLNTVLQGCWALLLSRYSGADDVLFGTVTSGRPMEIEGVERMVGLFINTLPLRVRVPEDAVAVEWLHALQEQNVTMRQYEYSPLSQIQQWSGLPVGPALFETLLVFENYPVDRDEKATLRFEMLRAEERVNYPLSVVVTVSDRIHLNAHHHIGRFDTQTVQRLMAHLTAVCVQVAREPRQQLGRISVLTEEERRHILRQGNSPAAPPAPEDLAALVADLDDAEGRALLEQLVAEVKELTETDTEEQTSTSAPHSEAGDHRE